jgi:hypothetical protein
MKNYQQTQNYNPENYQQAQIYHQSTAQILNLHNANTSANSLRKIKNAEKPCFHPEHNPPMHIYLEAGTYEYICPSCGKVTIFTVPLITF